MSYDPRTISFTAEIFYPPIQLRADLVQGVHNTLFRQPALGYQSFQIAPDAVHLTNLPQTPGQVSSLSFQADRMVFREEFRATTIEDFATRVVNIAGIAFSALSIPVSIAQQFCVRSLIALTPDMLRPGGALIFEFGFGQAAHVRQLIACQPALHLTEVLPDLQGIPRVAVVNRR